MKHCIKKIAAAVLCLCCMMALSSCMAIKNPFFVVDVSGNFPLAIEDTLSVMHYDTSVDRRVKIPFDGELYDGTYVKTYKKCDMANPLLLYRTDKGEMLLLDAESRTFAGINLLTPQYYETQAKKEDASDVAIAALKEKAVELLQIYVDVGEYRLKESITDQYAGSSSQNPIVFHKMQFYKEIDGIQTAESAHIIYDSKGNLIELCVMGAGAFDKIAFSDGEWEKTDMELQKKIDSLCRTMDMDTYTYEVEKEMLTADAEGNPTWMATVSICYGDSQKGKIILAKPISPKNTN